MHQPSRPSQPLQRFRRVLSGKVSKYLWKQIYKVKCEKTQNAISELTYHCQDLEVLIRALESRIAKLEDR